MARATYLGQVVHAIAMEYSIVVLNPALVSHFLCIMCNVLFAPEKVQILI